MHISCSCHSLVSLMLMASHKVNYLPLQLVGQLNCKPDKRITADGKRINGGNQQSIARVYHHAMNSQSWHCRGADENDIQKNHDEIFRQKAICPRRELVGKFLSLYHYRGCGDKTQRKF